MTEPDDEDDNARRRTNLIVLAAVAMIVVIGWFVIHEMVRLNSLEDCHLAGHHDCDQDLNSQ